MKSGHQEADAEEGEEEERVVESPMIPDDYDALFKKPSSEDLDDNAVVKGDEKAATRRRSTSMCSATRARLDERGGVLLMSWCTSMWSTQTYLGQKKVLNHATRFTHDGLMGVSGR